MADFDVRGNVQVEITNFVRDMDRVQRELRNAAMEAENLDRQLRNLNSRSVTVDVDIRGGLQLDMLWDQLEAMASHRWEIKVDLDLGDSVRNLTALAAAIGALTARPFNIDVDVQTAGAMASVAALSAQLAALSNQRVDVNVNRDMDSISRAAMGAGSSMGGLAGSFGSLMGPMAIFVTAALPVITVLSGIAAGAFGAFSAVAVGIGAFAAFAIPTIKGVMEGATALKKAQEDLAKATTADQIKNALAAQKAILDKLSPAQEKAIANLNKFKETYSQISKLLEGPALKVFAEALNFAQSGMLQLATVAAPAGDAIANVLKKASEGLQGDSWTKFFKYMRENVGFFIDTWLTGFGNIITAIGNLIVAFDPLSKSVSNGFLGMSERFLEWSKHLDTNKAFQDWIAYVKREGPKIWDTVKKIASVLWEFAEVLLPIGERVLAFIDRISGWAKALQEAHPELFKLVVNTAAFLLVVSPLIGPLTTLLGLLIGISAPMLLLVGLVAGLAAAFFVAYTKSEEFRKAVDKFAKEALQFMLDKWREVKEQFEKIWPRIVELWKIYGDEIMTFVKSTWETIKMFISGALDVIMGILKIFVGLFTGDWGMLWEGVKQTLSGAGEVMASIFKFAIDRIILVVQLFGEFLKTAFEEPMKKVGSTIKGWWDTAYESTTGWIDDMWEAIKDFFEDLPGDIGGWMKDFTKAIVDGFVQAVLAVPGFGMLFRLALSGINLFESGKALIQGWWNGIKEKWNEMVSWFQGVLNEFRSWWPFSPAKKGPFSGRGYTLYSGQAIIRDFRKGMEMSSPSLFSTASSIMQRVNMGGGMAPVGVAVGAGAGLGNMPMLGSGRTDNMGGGLTRQDIEDLMNRPVIVQVDSETIARAVETGNRSLDRRG